MGISTEMEERRKACIDAFEDLNTEMQVDLVKRFLERSLGNAQKEFDHLQKNIQDIGARADALGEYIHKYGDKSDFAISGGKLTALRETRSQNEV